MTAFRNIAIASLGVNVLTLLLVAVLVTTRPGPDPALDTLSNDVATLQQQVDSVRGGVASLQDGVTIRATPLPLGQGAADPIESRLFSISQQLSELDSLSGDLSDICEGIRDLRYEVARSRSSVPVPVPVPVPGGDC